MMKGCKKFLAELIVVFVGALGLNFCDTESVNATSYNDIFNTVDNLGHTQNIYRCYRDGVIKKELTVSGYNGITYLVGTNALDTAKDFLFGNYALSRNGSENCKEVLKLYSSKAPSGTANTDAITKFLKDVGYTINGSSSGDANACSYLTFKYNGKKKKTNQVCSVDGEFKIENNGGNKNAKFSIEEAGGNKYVCLTLFNNGQIGGKSAANIVNDCAKLGSKDSAIKKLPGMYAGATYSKDNNVQIKSGDNTIEFMNGVNKGKSTSGQKAVINEGKEAAKGKTATKFLTDKTLSSAQIKTSSLLGRLLYQGYLRNWYGLNVSCGENASGTAIQWYQLDGLAKGETKTTTCHYIGGATKHQNQQPHALNSSGFLSGTISFQDLLNAVNGMKTTYQKEEVTATAKLVSATVAEEEKKKESESGENGDGEAVCYEKSGALGWILCPVIKGLSAAGEAMWAAVSGMLNIPANETFNNSNGGVYTAWEIIRNIANVIFIILFLMVIFSQLTGIGIDNYGIKKILPKIIIAAILMNLSYVLCEVAVDISNILGNGLNQLFASQAGTIDLGAEAPASSGIAAGIVDIALAGAGAYLYVLFSPLGTIAIGIAVVSVIISIVTAVAFLYLILVIRQAGVILMVVLAPIAIACYMLPNTEKIYKRWFDLFKALLIVYPICGTIVGAGALASSVLGSIDNTAMKVAAMIVQVLPFFLIPTLLRQSLSLMGNIGANLQNVAGRVRRGATGAASNAMRNSETLKSLDNKLGMHSLSSRRRAAAFESEMDLRNSKFRRGRNSDVEIMRQRLADADANNEEKAINEDIERKMSSMQRNGIVMGDSSNASYSLENAERRVGELEKIARGRALSNSEQLELAALSRGMVGMKGGAGKLAKIVRHAGETRDGNGNVTGKKLNANFMSAMGDIYSRDNDVKNKMNEKDMGASIYTEQFMPGASADNRPDDVYSDFTGPVSNDGSNSWKKNLDARIKTYSAGLSQSGEATQEYLKTLTKEDCERIVSDEILYNGLDNDNRAAFDKYAKDTFGIERSVGGSGSNGVVAGSSGSAPDGYEERDSGFIVPHSR